MARTRHASRWGRLAAGWAILFSALHVYWALGGSVGLAESAGNELAAERPTWFVVYGLWGVAALLLLAAAVGHMLAVGRLGGRAQVLLRSAAFVIAAILLLRGMAIEALILLGVYDGNESLSAAQKHWTLVLWNPWFIAGGLAFAAALTAGWRSRGVRRQPG